MNPILILQQNALIITLHTLKAYFIGFFCYILFSESLYLMNQKDFKLTLE